MKRRHIGVVTATELAHHGNVSIRLDNGYEFETSAVKDAPKVGDMITIDVAWGEDFEGSVTPIRKADPVLEALLDEEEAIARSAKWAANVSNVRD